MRRTFTILSLAVVVVAAGSLVWAGGPPSSEKKGKITTGASHGEKTGWQSDYPPGWDKKSEQEKNEWKDTVKKKREGIKKAAKEKGMSEREAEAAADDFEKAARKGVDPEEAESVVKEKIRQGKKGPELSEAVSEETEKRLKSKEKGATEGKVKDKTKKK